MSDSTTTLTIGLLLKIPDAAEILAVGSAVGTVLDSHSLSRQL